MECCAKKLALAHCYDGSLAIAGHVVKASKHLDRWTYRLNGRSAEEHRMKRVPSERRHRDIGLEAGSLRTEGVAPGANVHRRQQRLASESIVGLARKQDQPGTGAPDRQARSDQVADRLV